MATYMMALDQGTTSSRCILFDKAGRICSMAQKEFTQYYPQPGWVEHDAMEIWSSQLAVAIEAVSKIGASAKDIAGIGITNQRETTIVWDRRTGKPICPAIVWQCRRTAERIERMSRDFIVDESDITGVFRSDDEIIAAANNGSDKMSDKINISESNNSNKEIISLKSDVVDQVKEKTEDMTESQKKKHGISMESYTKSVTGLIPDAYFSASKIEWILDHVEGARADAEVGHLLFGTVDSWLIWKLSGGKIHVTDYTNASRTMLFDIHKLCWDDTLLAYFHIPVSMLPEVRPSSQIYGYTDEGILGARIPLAGAAGDQQAALFGQCCFAPGDVKNTYGTGCFLLMNTGEHAVASQNGLLTTIAASADGKVSYALEGSVFVAGAGIQWLRDEMKLIDNAAESEAYAVSVPDTGGVYMVPAFTGIGAPYWNPYAKGTVVGLTRGCSKAHFIRAVLESMAYQSYDVLHLMEQESGTPITTLKVDGGASRNDFLMQFQADMLQKDVLRPECVETTALGAAYLAGLAVGYWEDTDEIRRNWALQQRFTPAMPQSEQEKLLAGWQRAVRCALAWARDM